MKIVTFFPLLYHIPGLGRLNERTNVGIFAPRPAVRGLQSLLVAVVFLEARGRIAGVSWSILCLSVFHVHMLLDLIDALKLSMGLSNGGVCINSHLQISANNVSGKQHHQVQLWRDRHRYLRELAVPCRQPFPGLNCSFLVCQPQ